MVNARDWGIHALGVWGLVGTEIPSSASQRVVTHISHKYLPSPHALYILSTHPVAPGSFPVPPMKRSAETEPQKRAKKVTAQAPKQSRPPELPPVACIISGLHADCKIAVARCLMQELGTNRVVALATDAEAAKQLLPAAKVRQFAGLSKSAGLLAKSLGGESAATASVVAPSLAGLDVLRASFASLPAALKQLSRAPFASFLSPNVVAISHELARPAHLAAALADGAGAVRRVTVVDGQSFVTDWEEGAKLPKRLTTAAPNENRKVSDVLADHVLTLALT